MPEASPDLPEDVAALQAMVALQNKKLSIFETEIKARDYRIEKLEHQLAGLRQHRFGQRSEALDQLELTLEEEEIARAIETPVEDAATTEKQKGKPKRKPLPDHLPRNDEVLSPGDACSACGGSLKTLGEDVTEELEYVPGRFVVNRTIRPRMACTCCDAFYQSPLPSRPIEKGRPGPGLLAHVLVNKYADHLPLYRQSQIFVREGVDLDRSTLADWVGKSAALLEPLANAIQRHVLAGQAIFADDTPVNMLSPGAGKTKTARLWAYVTASHGIARANNRPNISRTIPAGCTPMDILGSMSFINQAVSARSRVWRTYAASSWTSSSRKVWRLLRKRSNASLPSMASRRRQKRA